MPDKKPWCYLPVSAAAAIAMEEAEKAGLTEVQIVTDVSNLAAMINWRMGQGIYRFDETLYRMLWETPLEGRIPIDPLFRLPAFCVWIDTPEDPTLGSPGFFAFLDHDLNTGHAELRFSISNDGHYGPTLAPQITHLTGDTLEDCIEEAYQQSARIGEERGLVEPGMGKYGRQVAQAVRSIIAPRLSLVLYLCSDGAEVFDAPTGQRRPALPKPITDKKGTRHVAASLPTAWDVGVRIGATIRRAQAQERSEPQGGTHASPRPHWRKPHWHTFTRGTGRVERFIQWLPMLPIGYRDEDPGEGPAVIHGVEEEQ
ncbi:MAG: hypothetical protein MOB07_31120 [Acidobacteria bacterium]|nr:hypothetical protein [Acidobacteriota bacterium]